jgi:hypothetical protein
MHLFSAHRRLASPADLWDYAQGEVSAKTRGLFFADTDLDPALEWEERHRWFWGLTRNGNWILASAETTNGTTWTVLIQEVTIEKILKRIKPPLTPFVIWDLLERAVARYVSCSEAGYKLALCVRGRIAQETHVLKMMLP